MAADEGGTCEHLTYRERDDDHEFETARAYCTVVDEFVRPVRADVCNARYDLSPAEHCEFYREHEGIEDGWLTGAATVDGGPGSDAGDGADDPRDGADHADADLDAEEGARAETNGNEDGDAGDDGDGAPDGGVGSGGEGA